MLEMVRVRGVFLKNLPNPTLSTSTTGMRPKQTQCCPIDRGARSSKFHSFGSAVVLSPKSLAGDPLDSFVGPASTWIFPSPRKYALSDSPEGACTDRSTWPLGRPNCRRCVATKCIIVEW